MLNLLTLFVGQSLNRQYLSNNTDASNILTLEFVIKYLFLFTSLSNINNFKNCILRGFVPSYCTHT